MYILKRSGKSASFDAFKTETSKDPEALLMKKVADGTVTDAEINLMVKRGGESLRFMERRANSLKGNKEQLDRKYGKGAFDGVDNAGNPYKDIPLNSVKDTQYSKQAAEKVRPFIKIS